MKKNLGIISVIIFVSTLILYIISVYFGLEILPGKLTLAILILLPIIGVISSLMAKKGSSKVVGLVGNGFVLLIAGIIPLVASFFWNTP